MNIAQRVAVHLEISFYVGFAITIRHVGSETLCSTDAQTQWLGVHLACNAIWSSFAWSHLNSSYLDYICKESKHGGNSRVAMDEVRLGIYMSLCQP